MSDEIKPCPFCGGKPVPYHDNWDDYKSSWYWSISCDCGAEGEHRKTREEAIAAWNNRPIEDMLRARVAQLEHELIVGKIVGRIAIGEPL